jgi:hypothetical protein
MLIHDIPVYIAISFGSVERFRRASSFICWLPPPLGRADVGR